jgi:alkylation response protein AidB-like acyl-CoA dehydrogenase
MNFELSDDQVALREGARELLDGLASPAQVRAAVGDAGGESGWDRSLWKAMVDQGWLGIEVPEGEGGLGLGMVEAAVMLEEVGRHVAPVPFLQQFLALGALAGTDWAAPLLSGEAVATVAWGEGPALFAPSASVAVVHSDEALFAVDIDDARRPRSEPAMDRTRELGWLDLEGAPSVRLGGPEEAAAFLDRGATAHAAEMLGAAARALEMSVEYAKERVQFDRPIGSFQAVKHRCADMLVDVEGMRSAVYYAAWCIGAGHPDASVAASTAKTWCSDASRRVMASALQVHGGIGFTWEHDVHLYLKRAQLDQVSFGDATFHRARLASLLRPRVEAGESVV